MGALQGIGLRRHAIAQHISHAGRRQQRAAVRGGVNRQERRRSFNLLRARTSAEGISASLWSGGRSPDATRRWLHLFAAVAAQPAWRESQAISAVVGVKALPDLPKRTQSPVLPSCLPVDAHAVAHCSYRPTLSGSVRFRRHWRCRSATGSAQYST